MEIQEWLEMKDIRRRFYEGSVWVPLRVVQDGETGKFGYLGYQREFFGAGSIIVPLKYKDEAKQCDWSRLGINSRHSGYFEGGDYIPVHIYKGCNGSFEAEYLVLAQSFYKIEPSEWHLSYDLSITLGLKREGDSWVRPTEGYVEVVRLLRDGEGEPYSLVIRASHLKDYLCARSMALYITSFRERRIVKSSTDCVDWEDDTNEELTLEDKWEGLIRKISKGGNLFGSTTAIYHQTRTDVDPDVDVPIFDFPTDDVTESNLTEIMHDKHLLYLLTGKLWRNEWVKPGAISPIVRGDKTPLSVYFIVDAAGNKESKATLTEGKSRWLWFKPHVVVELQHYRGSALGWYTKDTGYVGCSPGSVVHFGVNSIGLINVYAKDIAQLPDWQQNIWAGFNVSPEGGVSEELLASQMRATPASTQAPEKYLSKGLDYMNKLAYEKVGISILREHTSKSGLLKEIHRFRAFNRPGLFALAKDIHRLIGDSINTGEIQRIVPPPKETKWGSLKSFEKLIASKVGDEAAYSIFSSLVGNYELRKGDAHLPGSEIDDALERVGIDSALPFVLQGRQLIHACVSSIYQIIEVFEKWDER